MSWGCRVVSSSGSWKTRHTYHRILMMPNMWERKPVNCDKGIQQLKKISEEDFAEEDFEAI